MAEFRLPENSRIRPGKVHKTPGAAKPRTFRIYRFEPESNENPRVDTFEVDLKGCGPMVLDALIQIKGDPRLQPDIPPLVPRRHLRFLRDEHQRYESPGVHDGHG